MKYGFLISIPGQYVPPQDWVFTLIASALLPVNILVALGVERVVADYYAYPLLRTLQRTSSYRPDEQTYRCWTVWSGWIHAANITVTLAFPSYVVYQKMYHPLLGMAIVFTVVIQSLKLISYALVNRCLRYDLVHGIPQPAEYTVHYPANIRLRDSLYFFWVPTLCYQPSYPRNQRFRKSFFLKRCLEGAIATVMIYFLVEQYAIPTLKNSITPWEQLNVPQILERVFKLSTTSVLIWLLGFYAFFHAFLNALAELLHFGDRSFYLPWWNSGTLARYWRLWNQPVHFFFKRHVYIPCLQAGFSPHTSMVLIFFISALLHELVVGIPTHNLRGHAFWGIFFQVPLVLFTDLLAQYTGKDSSIGNIFFWISFCILGQPFLVVRYFYDWTKQYLVV
ncbi:MBOAT, membrane-bound O-acyltransferase family-domain-containing protein [Dimargaris cristalligena]|uniref:diacylglycerol O-acyltransferase n=1 Tax=Dimargaris cristalligena TaxID=215637 RepID=A0A4P9ZKE3_9FUNG|nr:MBOAT, membrane-bound O-acyltransferase family-domain-containing protein [Dimargaris cristalligena]|eukprot:RKP33724.1 MBOAT, membrane-bound O-acyltransferase family-domain-containing protein [Dimargaris cristalligena]